MTEASRGVDHQSGVDVAAVALRASEEARQAEETLLSLASQFSPDALFAATLTVMIVAPEGTPSELTHGDVPSKLERLAFHLWRCPTAGTEHPPSWAVDTAIQAVDNLARQSIMAQTFDPAGFKDDLDRLMVRLSVDAQIIRGSAYPEQTSEEVIEIAGRFDRWFQENIGASATNLTNLVWAIVVTTQEKINGWLPGVFGEARLAAKAARITSRLRKRDAGDGSGHPRQVFNGIALGRIAEEAHSAVPLSAVECTMPDGSRPSQELWNTLVSLTGFTRDHALTGKDFLSARNRPLFVLQNGRVLLVDLPNALDCLWEALDRHAKSDEAFYDQFQKKES